MGKTAYIFQEPTGLFHFCDEDAEMLDARGRGYRTRVEAERAAAAFGFTSARGPGRKSIKQIGEEK
jgi:hypothetical protein